MIKIRGLASPSGSCGVSGHGCHKADLGWLQELGPVDGGWKRRLQAPFNFLAESPKQRVKQNKETKVVIVHTNSNGPVGENVQNLFKQPDFFFMIQRILCTFSMPGTSLEARGVAGYPSEQLLSSWGDIPSTEGQTG